MYVHLNALQLFQVLVSVFIVLADVFIWPSCTLLICHCSSKT